ncbi:GAF domain-containing protein [Mycolicibacterium sediminis]|uniref:GAF domain-containing protein n=1 Tax=Mycolicibacterium sediminis TaxID=1286180 RepID=A0A7I7QT33_9MYCO|nr:GAF domain-containing protein [Mycolicibacterium sediminis]BBY29553.1 hypothetical protein MSEDJ_36490 [Mycolicibacterium sediminis]
MSAGVYRAPLRSRRDDVPLGESVAWARRRAICGFGGVLVPPPDDLDDAVTLARIQYDERLARRIERFAAVPTGAYAWTRDDDGAIWLGRLTGPWHYDASPAAADVDLVHVRRCDWRAAPVPDPVVPPAVHATFARGGRNFQRIHDGDVEAQTRRAWH